jgi:hypothetical protein
MSESIAEVLAYAVGVAISPRSGRDRASVEATCRDFAEPSDGLEPSTPLPLLRSPTGRNREQGSAR